MPSQSCLMLLLGRINSTSLSGSKLGGKHSKGYFSQPRYPNSLESLTSVPEKKLILTLKSKWSSLRSLRQLIVDRTSTLIVEIVRRMSDFSIRNMASTLSAALNIAKRKEKVRSLEAFTNSRIIGGLYIYKLFYLII